VLAANDLHQDIERATGTCSSRIFPSLSCSFFSNEFLQTYYYCNGEVSVQLGVETDETVSKISFISICTWHMARSALSSHRTVTHLEVRVPKKLYRIVRIQRAAGCISLYISLAHHLGSQDQMPKKLYCIVRIERAAGCLSLHIVRITWDPVDANDFTPPPAEAERSVFRECYHAFRCCCCWAAVHGEIQQHMNISITRPQSFFSSLVVLCKHTANNPLAVESSTYVRAYFCAVMQAEVRRVLCHRSDHFISMPRM
jgi:hypothetical protein